MRRVFALGLSGFAAGGLIRAPAPSLVVLVLGRIVQGAGGAAIPALAIVSVAEVLPDGEHGVGIGLIGPSLDTAAAVGPVLGQFVGWHALFAETGLMLAPRAPASPSHDNRRFRR